VPVLALALLHSARAVLVFCFFEPGPCRPIMPGPLGQVYIYIHINSTNIYILIPSFYISTSSCYRIHLFDQTLFVCVGTRLSVSERDGSCKPIDEQAGPVQLM
jgi:hypothetical protein